MRLSREEKTVLKTGINKSLSALIFILLSNIIFSQIPFKGFGKLNSFIVDKGCTGIFSFNYDDNEYSDLLLLNQFNKNSILLKGKAGIDFEAEQSKVLPIEISKLKPVIQANGMIESYVFASRKSRTIGVMKYSRQGNATLKNKLNFEYYPENISVSDVSPDGVFDVAVSGNSFNGISIVSFQKNKIMEKKVKEDDVFKDAHFIDLNSDGFLDIAALSSVYNKVHLLYKNSNNEYEDLRQIGFNEKILTINVFDINYDTYKDIIVSTEKDIKIVYGDAFSSYNKIISVKTKYSADKFVIGDFNRDGYFDFNYINAGSGIISTIFSESFEKFYPELIHKKEPGVIDVIPYFSKFVYGTAYLYSTGKIDIISKVTSMSDDQQLAISISPDLITSFFHINDGIADLAFSDNEDHKIKFVIRDASGLPDLIYELPLYEDHSKIIVYSNSKFVKTFFLFSYNNTVIEAIEIDFNNFNFKRKYFYTKGSILDFAIRTDEKNDPELHILYSNKENLCIQIFSKTNFKYSSTELENLIFPFNSPFFVDMETRLIGVWKKENSFLNLHLIKIQSGKPTVDTKLKLKESDNVLFSFSKPDHKSKLKFLSLVRDGNNILIASGNEKKQIYGGIIPPADFRITSEKQLFFSNNNSIFSYQAFLKSLYEIIPDKTGEFYTTKKIFSDLICDNYIVQMLDQVKTHLIFTDSKNGLISIKQFPR